MNKGAPGRSWGGTARTKTATGPGDQAHPPVQTPPVKQPDPSGAREFFVLLLDVVPAKRATEPS